MSLFGDQTWGPVSLPFIPPVKLAAGDMLLPFGDRIGVYRRAEDGSGWDMETVYTLQDGAYRIVIDAPPPLKEIT